MITLDWFDHSHTNGYVLMNAFMQRCCHGYAVNHSASDHLMRRLAALPCLITIIYLVYDVCMLIRKNSAVLLGIFFHCAF